VGALSRTAGQTSPSELAAVLSALAGMRRGDAVAAVSASGITRACLAAGAARPLLEPDAADATARVLVVEEPADIGTALRLLAPGGRLVSLAADAAAARDAAAEHGLALRHVESLGDIVAWSAVRPPEP
jgi:hypothetical protein